jgi:hypothetical protein
MESIIIHRCFSDVEADQLKQLLEQEGIACQLLSHVPHSVYPFTMDGLGEIRIVVMESDAAQAKQIIDDFYSEYELKPGDEQLPENESEISGDDSKEQL